MTDRADAEQRDRIDPLSEHRSRFLRSDPETIYLDGNSLGMLPLPTRDRLERFTTSEWGGELVRGWPRWEPLPASAGDRVGALIGAAPGQVVVCDSISVNLFKLAYAAMHGQSGRKVLVSDSGNFPSDRYVLDGVARQHRGQLRLVPTDPVYGVSPERLSTYLADDVALVSLSHVDYRSGAIADLVALTDQAHRAGALVLWDLAHSAGAVPVDLDAVGADLAVGCTYKYLNAGPGAPGFLYVRRDLQDRLSNPIQGWWSTADKFAMDAPYQPASDITRFLAGTPPIAGVVAVDESAKMLDEVGIRALRHKSIQLTEYLIELADQWLTPLGLRLQSPRDPSRRGGHVVLAHDDAYRIGLACLEVGVVGDVRPPNLLRLAPVPISTSFVDVWEGLSRIRDAVSSGAHLSHPTQRARIT